MKEVNSTHVKNQGSTGTCWSFSTASFIESEIQRLSGTNIDISEMYFVRNTYLEKSWNYIMRQGKTQFGEGGLSHDVINSIEKYGIVPRSAFSGLINGENQYVVKTNVNKIINCLKKFYKNKMFVKISKKNSLISTNDVIKTNNCLISICESKNKNKIIILSAIDNLIKGGGGQAIQNLNILFNFSKNMGLK